MFKRKITTSSAFSDFIRNAPSGEKKKTYSKVLRKASKAQAVIVASASSAKSTAC